MSGFPDRGNVARAPAPDDAPPPAAAGRYAWYVVLVLMVVNVSALVDRQVLSLLVEPIKRDLALSDTQMSWLLGLAFAVFYSVLGFPIGRLADVRSRRAIIAWGTALWSVMCALCGLARTYTQLFLARVGVGVGEASLTPPAFSLIADYFPPRRLASAMSIFGVGTFLGSGLGYWIGGALIDTLGRMPPVHLPIVGELRTWQTVFLLLGAPGILIALLALTVREPARGASRSRADTALPVRDTFAHIGRHRGAFAAQGLGFAAFSLVNYATAAWFPAFFQRTHGWTSGQVGFYMGGATMVFGTLGILAGGWLADRLKRSGRVDGNMLVGIIASALALVVAFPLYLTSSFRVLIAALVVTNVAAALPWGAAAAALQEITPAPMRGQMSAIYLLLINVLGLGLGPTVVALLTDHVFGSEALVAMSLLTVTIGGRVLTMVIIGLGLAPFRGALRDAPSWGAQSAATPALSTPGN